MGNESKKNNKKIVIPILVIGVILVLAGLGFNYLTSSKYVAKEAIKGLSNNMIKLLDSQKNITGLEENFTTTSNIKVNLQSDYFSSLATVSPTYQAISNLLKNISQIETQITYVQDKKNKRMFVSYDSKMASQPFINGKYLIENSTEYYYIDGLTQSYINNGNNNYFESLTSTTTDIDNIKYIIEKINESLQNNLKKDYISESYEKDYKKVTITLTKDSYMELSNNILKDLKNDSKAKQIITGYNQDFEQLKLTKKDVENQSTIRIHICIDKLLGKIKQYIIESNDVSLLLYKESEKSIIEHRENDKLKTRIEIINKNEKTEITLKNEEEKTIGKITISKTDTNYDVVANLVDEQMTLDIGFNSQITNLKKGKSYNSSQTVNINISSNNIVLLNGTIDVSSTTTNDTTINEDLSSSVLASSLDATQSEILSQKLLTTITQLTS